MDEKAQAINAITKKLVGKRLNYKEIYAIMDQIAQDKLGDILTTYFAASGVSNGFNSEEIYFLTKAMVETGEKLQFDGIVADKHSIGGVPGTRTTMIVIPIIAAAGFKIPKSSSRAITTPGGTADDFEILAPVNLSKEKIYSTVKKTNGCIVWGGSFNIAPADDVIIKVEEELLFESYDKILISIMAKKVAFGSTHVVIDLPYGKSVKIHTLKDALSLKTKFRNLAKRFDIKIDVLIHNTEEPAGRGIGPMLETRDALYVLEQSRKRAPDLEARSINLAGSILELCLADSSPALQRKIRYNYKNGMNWALDILISGQALKKLREIIKAQGGNSKVTSDDLIPGKHTFDLIAEKDCTVESFDIKRLSMITRVLGAPNMKTAGVYLHKKLGETAKKGEAICTFYTDSVYNLKEGKQTLKNFPFITFK
jgi:AMP phosphorylase